MGSGKPLLFWRQKKTYCGNSLDTSTETGGGRVQFAFASQMWWCHFLGKIGSLTDLFGPVLKEFSSYRNVACVISGEEPFR